MKTSSKRTGTSKRREAVSKTPTRQSRRRSATHRDQRSSRSIDNATIAGLLRRYATTLKIAGADRFKMKAYLRAADTVEVLREPIADLVQRGEDLRQLPAIGAGLSAVIQEIVASGTFAKLDDALSTLSPEVAELATRPRLDPKRIARVYKKLDIHSLDELAAPPRQRRDSNGLRRPEWHSTSDRGWMCARECF